MAQSSFRFKHNVRVFDLLYFDSYIIFGKQIKKMTTRMKSLKPRPGILRYVTLSHFTATEKPNRSSFRLLLLFKHPADDLFGELTSHRQLPQAMPVYRPDRALMTPQHLVLGLLLYDIQKSHRDPVATHPPNDWMLEQAVSNQARASLCRLKEIHPKLLRR